MEILISLLRRIEMIYTKSPNFELIRSYLFTFLTELKTNKSIQNKTVLSAAERIAYEFKQALARNVKSFRTIDQYAQLLNITPNHLNKCVKTVFGKPTSLIIDEMLVLEAKVLLHRLATAISEVGFEIGFEDPSYFGRFFKKKTGFTPTEFRRMIDLSD